MSWALAKPSEPWRHDWVPCNEGGLGTGSGNNVSQCLWLMTILACKTLFQGVLHCLQANLSASDPHWSFVDCFDNDCRAMLIVYWLCCVGQNCVRLPAGSISYPSLVAGGYPVPDSINYCTRRRQYILTESVLWKLIQRRNVSVLACLRLTSRHIAARYLFSGIGSVRRCLLHVRHTSMATNNT